MAHFCCHVLSTSFFTPKPQIPVLLSPGVACIKSFHQYRLLHIKAMQDDNVSTPMPCDESKVRVPHVLTVAGSDSGAGAGIQADLKACAARGVYCSTVITAVTAQNTVGVQGVNIVPEDFVAEQLRHASVNWHSENPLSKSEGIPCTREELLPMADIVTPNLKEASALLGGVPLETIADMRSAAKAIHDIGPRNVLVKGGDLPASLDAVDVFYDGNDFYEFRSSRIMTPNTHGTGCTLASTVAAELAKGSEMLSAVKVAKRYVAAALSYSKNIVIGGGRQGPMDHLLKLKSSVQRRLFDPCDLFLYAVTDSRMNKKWGRSIVDAVKAAIEGGATIIQLREKEVETSDFLEAAKACLKICRVHGVSLLINDRIDVALASDADGVHIGQSDMPAHVARALLGPDKIIGVSCKTPEQAQQAWLDGADYIGSGGVYPTNTKENNKTIGLDGLKTVCLSSKLPVVAIGGIGMSNAQAVMELGVPNLKGVAVVSALFDRECVLTETRKLLEVLKESTKIAN
ncbi:thiamine biosynthetic bifunctional enzyme TH1, chloroplastic isoform X2 [Lycium barbarum]|uniref:thiamine biosynthetic bifunctional enzyme TH1, chloroplastic isoform X2 n=1 Tax=Lycium barbarum TaxID=112863 RepID=UPI00293EBFC8|nr:thiamine biosynthetic bifunctional enzyme TH1, chloroplastic isoform X2 [Lycium barbarum]